MNVLEEKLKLSNCMDALENLGYEVTDVVPFTLENILEMRNSDLVVDLFNTLEEENNPLILKIKRLLLCHDNETSELSIKAITETYGEVLTEHIDFDIHYVDDTFSDMEGFITLLTCDLFQPIEHMETEYSSNRYIFKINIPEENTPIAMHYNVKEMLLRYIGTPV